MFLDFFAKRMIKAQLKIIYFSYSKYIIINKSMLFQAFQLLDTITIFNDKNAVEKHQRNLPEVIQFPVHRRQADHHRRLGWAGPRLTGEPPARAIQQSMAF
jgi:hypothetical protein